MECFIVHSCHKYCSLFVPVLSFLLMRMKSAVLIIDNRSDIRFPVQFSIQIIRKTSHRCVKYSSQGRAKAMKLTLTF